MTREPSLTDVPAHAPLCAAADPAPRKPAFATPAGACDTHAHICGPASQFEYASERIYTPPDATLADYRRMLAALGVERAVLVQPSVYGADNSAMVAALLEGGPGLRAVAVVEPEISKARLAVLHGVGVRGVRLNIVDRREGKNVVPAELVRDLAARIAPFGWHIEFLVNMDVAPGFAAAVAGLPVPIVLGHMGYPSGCGAAGFAGTAAFDELRRLLDGGRCWVKMTGPYRISSAPDLPYADVDVLAGKLVAAAPERLIWGSDWPHVMMKKPMPNDGPIADLLARWAPDAAIRRRILVDNPAELYGFAPDERISA